MNYLEQISKHKLVTQIMQDGDEVFKNRNINIVAIDFTTDPQFNEYEYYVHAVGFSLVHFLNWCKQLTQVTSIVSNFNYKTKSDIKINRAEHLIYNVENYLIRLQSIYDRILQLINSIFHLGIKESLISHEIIITNLKVSRTKVPNALKPLKRFLNTFSEKRNIIIHRYSYRDLELRKIELAYMSNFSHLNVDEKNELEKVRSRLLRKTIIKKKKEFSETNNDFLKLILPIFDELLKNYNKQKERLNLLI